jgi:hypothetical protein
MADIYPNSWQTAYEIPYAPFSTYQNFIGGDNPADYFVLHVTQPVVITVTAYLDITRMVKHYKSLFLQLLITVLTI